MDQIGEVFGLEVEQVIEVYRELKGDDWEEDSP